VQTATAQPMATTFIVVNYRALEGLMAKVARAKGNH